MTIRFDGPLPGRRRPGLALLVLALHLVLAALLWRVMHQRVIEVSHDRAPLVWVQVPTAKPPPPTPHPPLPARPPREAKPPPAANEPKPRPTVKPPAPRESTWVEPAPAVVAASPAAPASAASAPPAERLLDSAATRAAIRQTGRQALLQERAAAATGLPIERTDTALAQQVAEAGKPDCLKDPNAASGQIGPIGVGGILGLPFLAARVVSGNCAK
jgi:outer membrane biosynthesis protein TonB